MTKKDVSQMTTRYTALLAATLALAGCAKTITNDEIITEHKKCAAAGLRTDIYHDMNNNPIRVECATVKP